MNFESVLTLFDKNRIKLSALVALKDPGEIYILSVIESVVESSCLPSHIDEINLFLKKEIKRSEDLRTKIMLLFK